jgi:fatty-acyl-CoA synthase
VGEIRVRGETVSPGYWGRPEETAEAFRDGWLHTGDLAVVDALGWVDIVDRRKDVILSGGESVYSIEVENALSEHPSVAQAAVFGRPDAEWGERVCAAVVPVPDADPDGGDVAARLVEHCRERLASFKVPREVHLVDELPTTGSGKVHKPALRVRFGARVDRG